MTQMIKPSTDAYCDVYFVRHGETDWNAKGLLQGHQDIPLNQVGYQQAATIRETLASIPFVAAFSSDLSRAKQTAEVIIQERSIALTESSALRERQLGIFEGRNTNEFEEWIKQSYPHLSQLPQEGYISHQLHPTMETVAEVYQRTKNFLDLHISSYLGSPILVVSHGGVIRSLLDYLDFKPRQKWNVNNCAFLHFKAYPTHFVVETSLGITRKIVD